MQGRLTLSPNIPSKMPLTLSDSFLPPTSAGGQGEVPRGTVLRASLAGKHGMALQEEARIAAVADLVTKIEG